MFQEFSKIPFEKIALLNGREGYSYGYFTFLANQNRGVLDWIKGWNICVKGTNADLAKMLPVLNRHVSSILLMPGGLDEVMISNYYQQASVNAEVSLKDDKLILSEIESPPNTTGNKKSYQTNWIIPTSGTTGHPKLVSHSFESLTRTTQKNYAIGNTIRWGLTYDLIRFAGLQVFLQAMLSGSTLLIPNSKQIFSEQIEFFVKGNCNAISATPSFWRKVLMHKESRNLELRNITLGGEIVDQQILDHLKELYSKAKIVHIYASTEAGVGFSVKDGREGFPVSYLQEGVQDNRVKVGGDGILYLKPEKENQFYIGENQLFEDDGFINTGDLVKVDGDRVKFLGRASGAINIGGNKVLPEEIEKQLLGSGLVKDVHIYGARNSITGMIVKADVVPDDSVRDQNLFKKEIRNYCMKNLQAYKVPAVINIVNEISLNNAGKLERKK